MGWRRGGKGWLEWGRTRAEPLERRVQLDAVLNVKGDCAHQSVALDGSVTESALPLSRLPAQPRGPTGLLIRRQQRAPFKSRRFCAPPAASGVLIRVDRCAGSVGRRVVNERRENSNLMADFRGRRLIPLGRRAGPEIPFRTK